MCSRVANSCRHILQRILLRLCGNGVDGTESPGVRGFFANMSIWSAEPSPSVDIILSRVRRISLTRATYSLPPSQLAEHKMFAFLCSFGLTGNELYRKAQAVP